MKTMKTSGILLVVVFLCTLTACETPLQEETFSTLGPSNFYNSAEDAEALLNAVYANSQGWRDLVRDYLAFGEATTDIMIEREGAINALMQPMEDFTWSSTHPWLNFWWSRYYSAIFRANLVLDRVPDIDMNEERKEQILAEARFLRAFNYFYLYDLFGPVPIIQTSETSVEDRPSRPTEEEFNTFIENEFLAVSEILPPVQEQYGRPTSGAALGFLCKFYLNDKQWDEAAATARTIMDSGVYDLYTEGNRTDLFAIDNQEDNEFIYVIHYPDGGAVLNGDGNTYLSHAVPDGWNWTYTPMVIFAADFKIRSEFLELFNDPDDERLDAFVFEYVNQAGDSVQLGEDEVRSLKYPEDPNGTASVTSSDFPLLRYADILLSRSEALNEINGPTQESIDLINDVREAAGVNTIVLADFSGKQELRDFILAERGREFHTESLRRQDLIRHGEFIEMATARGKQAFDYQVLFPIPQSEIDRNPNLEQNEGY